jgi:hypothetical protein
LLKLQAQKEVPGLQGFSIFRERNQMNENHKNHKLMWNELARTGGPSKHFALEVKSLPHALHNCYACESTRECFEKNCNICPIEWVEGKKHLAVCQTSPLSPFFKWEHAENTRTRKKYALIIANMKWRTKK